MIPPEDTSARSGCPTVKSSGTDSQLISRPTPLPVLSIHLAPSGSKRIVVTRAAPAENTRWGRAEPAATTRSSRPKLALRNPRTWAQTLGTPSSSPSVRNSRNPVSGSRVIRVGSCSTSAPAAGPSSPGARSSGPSSAGRKRRKNGWVTSPLSGSRPPANSTVPSAS